MRIRTLTLLMTLSAIAVFAALNWSTIMSPTTLSLGVATVQAPLGLIMLGLIALLTALFLVFVVAMQTSVLLEARRHAREMQSNRTLAEQAEMSRFNELRLYLEHELQKLAARDSESNAAIAARLDRLEHELRGAVEESGNTLAAYIGELEDRIDRK